MHSAVATMKSKHTPPPMPEPPMPVPDPDPLPSPKSKMTRFVIAIAIIGALGCGIANPIPPISPISPVATPEPQTCEADYYRGVYTLCMVLNAQTAKSGSTQLVDCNKLVEEAVEKDWYELEAPGFEWPLPELVSGLSVRYDTLP